MRRTYRFLLRPTCKQANSLIEMLRDHRDLYNAALEERRGAWRKQRKSVSYATQSAQLPAIRSYDPDQRRWGAGSQQATLAKLHRAVQGFFQRLCAGERAGYPRFKSSRRFNSVTWPSASRKDGTADGCRWNSTPDSKQCRAYFKGIGHIRVHAHRSVVGRIKTMTVKREGRRWYVHLHCDDVPARCFVEPSDGPVGIDLGVASLVTTSDGKTYRPPRLERALHQRVAAAQRRVARCKRGSTRRRKAVAHLGLLMARVRRQRLDIAHKIALDLVRRHGLVAHERLRVSGMTRRPAPRHDGDGGYLPNGAAAKAGLNRSIYDAGWGVLLQCLTDKAEEAGRVVVAVAPHHTSQRCHECGHTAAENRVTQSRFRCCACGFQDHADINAARNVLGAGLALREASA